MENTNGNTSPVYTLKVAAQLSETSVYSIRQYIDKGLILPFKTETNRHLFSQVDIARLKCIRKYLDELGLNVAGIKVLHAMIPCWLLRPCSEEDRKSCDAYNAVDKPCWEVTQRGPQCMDVDCRTCEVYQLPDKCNDLKNLFKNEQEILKVEPKISENE